MPVPRIYEWVDSAVDDYLRLRLRVKGLPEAIVRLYAEMLGPDGAWRRVAEAEAEGPEATVDFEIYIGEEPATIRVEEMHVIELPDEVEIEPDGCWAYKADGEVEVLVDGVPYPFERNAWVACQPFRVKTLGASKLEAYPVGEQVLRTHDIRVLDESLRLVWAGVVEDARPFTVEVAGAPSVSCPGTVSARPGETVEVSVNVGAAGTLTVLDETGTAVYIAEVEPGTVTVELEAPGEPGTYTYRVVLTSDGETAECSFTIEVVETAAAAVSCPSQPVCEGDTCELLVDTEAGRLVVTVDGTVVYDETVDAGTVTVTLPYQPGAVVEATLYVAGVAVDSCRAFIPAEGTLPEYDTALSEPGLNYYYCNNPT